MCKPVVVTAPHIHTPSANSKCSCATMPKSPTTTLSMSARSQHRAHGTKGREGSISDAFISYSLRKSEDEFGSQTATTSDVQHLCGPRVSDSPPHCPIQLAFEYPAGEGQYLPTTSNAERAWLTRATEATHYTKKRFADSNRVTEAHKASGPTYATMSGDEPHG